MATRRGFLAGLLSTGLAPALGWADAGDPAYLAAARQPDGSYHLYGLTARGAAIFHLPLPGRGHAAAAHPQRPEAVAFARRPGTFAIVLDCATGETRARLEAPEGRHFYGHGAFSADGTVLLTPENDFETARGVIGLWDAAHGYARLGEIASGGTGPHEIRRLPGTDIFAVANGGIETHPASGRAKLNIPFMQPNLSYVTLDGTELDRVELPHDMHRNSIRHLSVRDDGRVAFAMQWQGDTRDSPPLAALHRRGDDPVLAVAEADAHRRMQGYAGSIAFSADGARIAITSPRGGLIQVFDAEDGRWLHQIESRDVCGVNAGASGFVYTSGTGRVGGGTEGVEGGAWTADHAVAWDNHLVRIAQTVPA
ncbi:DUF1513 domain-containing protein [Psychromarinibacter sp. C21-152]|uniref:DUF1513 domain-containing protein n=1 Tax=Psychromarinibacter sediminicola TaxID=3033385 RepID=A0AAE3NZ22_9RHOB|nr:DUF1513 domain-containing protein [Psychromarinibacter sediminicola]MDF0603332.1 DUF1513 domain-containing protein [Psychromarinibacter sediminicola]